MTLHQAFLNVSIELKKIDNIFIGIIRNFHECFSSFQKFFPRILGSSTKGWISKGQIIRMAEFSYSSNFQEAEYHKGNGALISENAFLTSIVMEKIFLLK